MTELSSVFQVPITKIKTATGNATLTIDINELSDEVIHAITAKGLEMYINARMTSKVGPVTKLTGKDLADAHATALRIATENLEDLKAGNIVHSRAKAKKSTINPAIRAEAMRLAKTAIKDWVRAKGEKPSRYDDKAYTAKAREYVDSDPSFLAQATENIEARKTPTFNLNMELADLGPKIPRRIKPDLPAGVVARPQVQTTHRSVN